MSRADQITGERRRRDTSALGGMRMRLAVNEAALDRANYEYRWVNDELNRVHDLTVNDDWEVVQDRDNAVKQGNTGAGAEVASYAGTGGGASPVRAVLLRKPKSYHDADKAAAQRQIDEMETGIKNPSGDQQYVPKEGISVKQAGRA
jgi:hypothetical protein